MPSSTRQSGLSLPIVAVMLIALAAGFIAFTQFGLGGPAFRGPALQGSDSTTAENEKDKAALARVQEQLETSLALPLDFKKISNFQLLDVNAEAITQAVFEDTWSLVFFGYTHCPDVCPITLQVMKNVVTKLEEQNKTPPQIVFVSVDPVRDTSDIMKQYMAYFNPSFVGITGELKSIHEFTRSLGIVASFTANDSNPDEYIVDHTASILLIDPERRVRAKVTPPHKADTIVADYLVLTTPDS